MNKTKFQGGGQVIDEDALFDDNDGGEGQQGNSNLDGELFKEDDPEEEEEEGELSKGNNSNVGVNTEESELTGVEHFLTQYGIQGGIITYEDSTTARFVDLPSKEQAEILSSLVSSSTPSVEQKYDLDEDEVNLLNNLRESNMTSEEFINDLISYRMQAVLAQSEQSNADYTLMSDDAIFVKNLQDTYEEISNEEIAAELERAKALPSFETTTEAMRRLFIAEQSESNSKQDAERNVLFQQELEAQREQIVQTVEDISDIAGAGITAEMKEYLLHDIMELNDNQDPILMEKIFSDPETMFKVNWFLNYGEAYMQQTTEYWRGQVSKAAKEGYLQATKGMPGSPVNIGGVNKRKEQGAPQIGSFGTVISEEELFDEKQ